MISDHTKVYRYLGWGIAFLIFLSFATCWYDQYQQTTIEYEENKKVYFICMSSHESRDVFNKAEYNFPCDKSKINLAKWPAFEAFYRTIFRTIITDTSSFVVGIAIQTLSSFIGGLSATAAIVLLIAFVFWIRVPGSIDMVKVALPTQSWQQHFDYRYPLYYTNAPKKIDKN